MPRDELWDDLKVLSKQKRLDRIKANLELAEKQDDGDWLKFNEYHWQRKLNGEILDYWPSKRKWRYKKKIVSGCVYAFLSKNLPNF